MLFSRMCVSASHFLGEQSGIEATWDGAELLFYLFIVRMSQSSQVICVYFSII
jgi:hypothetical protein